ncbi:PmbA protein [Sphingomonas guangdongensis]|uniref:PmbA protein n=1 Tax=Sphingomonas guangdongensis TaxID=1141890 RepID=A0A285QYU0_9SPHN|nr:metallopeptidase TldD-related protein [Sphingomonas guangdongensis]SOB86724.1 PmbA protein [Sphingomonas guangdongensis]
MLSPTEATDAALAAITAARASGADAADAVFVADAADTVTVRMGALEDVGRSESAELGLRVFVGQRSASVATSDLSADAIAALVERAVAMARLAPEDRWAGLAPAERLLKGPIPDLGLDDGGDATPEALKARALAVEKAARGVPGVTLSDGASASASRVTIALATSHGFAGGYSRSSYGASASVLAGDAAGAMQRDYASHSVRHQNRLDPPDAIGRLAGERAAARVNPGRIDSGTMPVVFDRRVASSLVGALVGAIGGAAIARRTSFLLDALGSQILPKGVAIHDDPHRPGGLRSKPFDGEGLPMSPTAIVADGVLQTWLLDSAAARQLGLEPTGHAARGIGAPGVSATNLYMAAGATSRAALIGEVDRGVLVTELIGHGVNGVTGDYSLGAAGFLIERGEVTLPVAEFTIAGNLKRMYASLTPANDLEFRAGTNAPTVRIDGMTVAGG